MKTSVATHLTIDLSPKGALPCPTRSRRPKSQAGWWVIGDRDSEALHFVRLPRHTRAATLAVQAQGDWVIELLACDPQGPDRLSAPIAAFDARESNSREARQIDLLACLLKCPSESDEVGTRDTSLARASILGDLAFFLLLGKAELSKAPAIFKSVRILVEVQNVAAAQSAGMDLPRSALGALGTRQGMGGEDFAIEAPEDLLCDARDICGDLVAADDGAVFPERIEIGDGTVDCFGAGSRALPFARDVEPVDIGGRRIGRLHMVLFGRKIALGAMPGRLEIRYTDGEFAVAPLAEGLNCGNAVREKWLKGPRAFVGPHGPTGLPAARLVWIAPARPSASPSTINLPYMGVFATTWVNPCPEAAVESIRFVGARGRSELYLLGARATPPGMRFGLAAHAFSAISGEEPLRFWICGINELSDHQTPSVVVRLIQAGREVARREITLDLPESGGTAEEIAFDTGGLEGERYEAILESADGRRLDWPLEVSVLDGDWRRRPLRRRGVFEAALDLEEARPETLLRLRLSGFGLIRLKIPWRILEPERGGYCYAPIDAVIDKARRLGLLLELTIEHSRGRSCPLWLDLQGRDEAGRQVRKPSVWDERYTRALLQAWGKLSRAYKDEPCVVAWRIDIIDETHVWSCEPGRVEGYETLAREAFIAWLRAAGHSLKKVSDWTGDGVRSWDSLPLPRTDRDGTEALKVELARFRAETAARLRQALAERVERESPNKEILFARDVTCGYLWDGSGESLQSHLEALRGCEAEWRTAVPETHGRPDLFGRAGRVAVGALGGELGLCPPHWAGAREAIARLATLGGRTLAVTVDPRFPASPGNLAGWLPALDTIARCEPAASNLGLFVCEFPAGAAGRLCAPERNGAGRAVAAGASRFTRLNLHHLPVYDFQPLEPKVMPLIVDAGNARIDCEAAERLRQYVAEGGVLIAFPETDEASGHALSREFGLTIDGAGGKTWQARLGDRLISGAGPCLRISGGTTLAVYEPEQTGAVVEIQNGRGRFIAVGFPWLQNDPAGFRQFLIEQLGRVPAAPPYVIDDLFVESGLFIAPDGTRLLVVWNAFAAVQAIAASLFCLKGAGAPAVREIVYGLPCAVSVEADVPVLRASLPPRELALFRIA